MRQLTLNEKITIRGLLSRMGVNGIQLLTSDLKELMFTWNRCYRRSITQFHRYH